jgi:RNA polymerase-interacting CarD/CdnL/TRCF family regulator
MALKFKIGEVVVEPTIGICNIEGIKRMTVDGKTEDYYVFHSGNAKVMVPRSQIDKRGVRKPMTKDEVKKILQQLKVPVSPQRADARQQYLMYRDVLKSGDPIKIAKMLRDLFTWEQMDDLKGKEKELMELARRFLVEEITYVLDQPKTTVTDDINEALKQMYKKKVAKDREKKQKASTASSESAAGVAASAVDAEADSDSDADSALDADETGEAEEEANEDVEAEEEADDEVEDEAEDEAEEEEEADDEVEDEAEEDEDVEDDDFAEEEAEEDDLDEDEDEEE